MSGLLEEKVVSVLALIYAILIFVLRNVVTVLFYFQRSFPQVSSWITLMVGVYCAFKSARKLFGWWYGTALLLVKSFIVTISVIFGLYLYSRGINNFVAIDFPQLQYALSYLYSLRSGNSGHTAADYINSFTADDKLRSEFARESALDYMHLWKAAHEGWDNVQNFMVNADPDGSIQDSVKAFFNNRGG